MGGILGNEAWRRSNGGVWLPRVFGMPEVMYGWCSCEEDGYPIEDSEVCSQGGCTGRPDTDLICDIGEITWQWNPPSQPSDYLDAAGGEYTLPKVSLAGVEAYWQFWEKDIESARCQFLVSAYHNCYGGDSYPVNSTWRVLIVWRIQQLQWSAFAEYMHHMAIYPQVRDCFAAHATNGVITLAKYNEGMTSMSGAAADEVTLTIADE